MAEVSLIPSCCFKGCHEASVRSRNCNLCQQYLIVCAEHLVKAFHLCSLIVGDKLLKDRVSEEVQSLPTQINIPALLARAASLNGGQTCTFLPGNRIGDKSMMGCCNYHAWLVFDSGERWIIRVPRRGWSNVSESLLEYFVASEFATLKFLETTKVPAPKTFDYGLVSNSSNKVGVTYLLMEALLGEPHTVWKANPEKKKLLYEGIADILIELHKHPLPMAGSFLMVEGSPKISKIASDRTSTLHPHGPFDTPNDYYKSFTEQYLDLIADGKGDHLLLGANGRVTGIIDWQCSSTVPLLEAFGPSLVTADLNAMYEGRMAVTEDDKLLSEILRAKGAIKIADTMHRHEMARRLHFGLGSGSTQGEVWDLIKGLFLAFGPTPAKDVHTWMQEAMLK